MKQIYGRTFLLFLTLVCIFQLKAQTISFENCDSFLFTETDNIDSDGDGVLCEFMVAVTQKATYINEVACDLSAIHWNIQMDIDNDDTIDYEYLSSLPEDDMQFDDSNGNGVPDVYTSPSMSGELKELLLQDINGPQSSHRIIWKAYDECGNELSCIQSFEVLDTKPPSPFCISIASYTYTEMGNDSILAKDLQIGVFDQCTVNENLRYSFSPDSIVPSRLITCDDVVNSPLLLNMYSWDEVGNKDFCVIYVRVNSVDAFECHDSKLIDGYVKDSRDRPIPNALVILYTPLPEFPFSTLTDDQGYYSFGQQLRDLEYEITIEKEEVASSQVSSLDLVSVLRHLLGVKTLSSKYDEIAADVNCDGILDATDLYAIRKVVLGITSQFTNCSTWKFLDESIDLSLVPDFSGLPFGIIEVEPTSNGPFNFVGMKTGDVN